MSSSPRVTGPLLRVLDLLLQAVDRQLHGWQIMKEARLTGPTVYRVLDQLEDWGWVEGTWDQANSPRGHPRTRLYRLTPSAEMAARSLIRESVQAARARSPRLSPRPGFVHLAGWLPTHDG